MEITKMIKQKQLSEECWEVQIWGQNHCKVCIYKNTKECGGKAIIKTGKNKLGYAVPLQNA